MLRAPQLVERVTTALAATSRWPVDNVAAGVVDAAGTTVVIGDHHRRFEVASLTKPVVAHAVLIAVEERVMDLDQPVPGAQDGCTLRHLLAHAGGYPFDADHPLAPPGTTRIYSNTGYEMIAAGLTEQTGLDIGTYLREAVLEPLDMDQTELRGSAGGGLISSLGDLLGFLEDVLTPTLIDSTTRDEALRPQWPDLAGIVPGVGHFEPCPWGLGFELAGDKAPHWMGRSRSARTAGHFGAGGSMMWVDPTRQVGLVALSDRSFGTWAAEAVRSWAQLSDAIIDAVDQGRDR